MPSSRLFSLTFLAIAACQPAAGGPPVYVGAVEDSDALIAIATQGDGAVAYVCAEQTWEQHTGWFLMELENGALRPAASATGHTLEGVVIEGEQATGRIRFADGTEHRFTAPKADPRTSAGLYESHASEGQAGLIVTNDGRAAGAVKLPTGTDAPPVTGAITVNQPVGAGTTGTGGIAVTVPVLGDRTLKVIDVAKTVVLRTSPTLYILVHGMNHPVQTEAALVDTPKQSRTEWHLDFFQGLLGGPEHEGRTGHMPIFDFSGAMVTQDAYADAGTPTMFDAFASEGEIPAMDELASHFFTDDVSLGDVRANDQQPLPVQRYPMQSVFVTYRDASGGLVESGRRIANEAYVAVRWYEEHFDRTPKVVFVTQSFGGVTARFVLSNPTQAMIDAPGLPAMNADHITIDAEDRRRMDYVRDRIMYLVTMGTPHEGSFMADLFVDLQQNLRALTLSLESGTAGLQGELLSLAGFMRELDDLTALALQGQTTTVQSAAQTAANVRAGLAEVNRRLDGRALRDLRHDYWARVNGTILHPSRARRTPASPIPNAGGRLIPVYAAGARTPGGRAFTAPEMAVFRRYAREGAKEQEWMASTVATDILIHALRANQNGFGRADQGIYAGFADKLDRRQRLVDGSAFVRDLAQDIAQDLNPFVEEELGANVVEAIVEPLMGPARSAALPIYLSRKGGFTMNGTLPVRVPEFRCTDDDGNRYAIRLDFGRLLTLMKNRYGSLSQGLEALLTLDLNGVLEALSLINESVDDILDWFLGKYTALQVAEGKCKLPSDVSISSVLAVVNLPNWKIGSVEDYFPAPKWEFSNVPASDDEIDDDGVVGFESAVGFSLGTTTPLFFDHTRNDANGLPGSWYRIFDSPLEKECHGMQHQWDVGRWVRSTFANAGPVPAAQGELSVFP